MSLDHYVTLGRSGLRVSPFCLGAMTFGVMASFRGWAPLVALQIEYSLLERTVEGELLPMAQELGLGVTPWSPLRGGVLTGKYTRENVKNAKPGRDARVSASLDERTFVVIDELVRVAGELDTTPAAVALAWVQAKPEVDATIIGVRTMEQLEQNLRRARRRARPLTGRDARPCVDADPGLSDAIPADGDDHHARRVDGRWRGVGGLADGAAERRRAALKVDSLNHVCRDT